MVICNQSYMDMYRLSRDVIKPGVHFRDVIAHRKATGSFAGDVDAYVRDVLTNSRKETLAIIQTADNRSIQILGRPVPDGGWVATHEDITERRRSEERIAHLAHYDALTDLPNRVLFRDQLTHELTRVARGQKCAVIYIDIDEFKSINDSLGHPVGDELLKTVASRLKSCIRASDVVARLGGDEFAIVQTDVSQDSDITELVTRIHQAIREPIECFGHRLLDRRLHRHRHGAARRHRSGPAAEERGSGDVRAPRPTAAAPSGSSRRKWTPASGAAHAGAGSARGQHRRLQRRRI